jgi:hypothetical protein
MEKDVGKAALGHAVSACGDVSITRPQLLVQFEAIIRNYPHSQDYQRAKQMADILKQMIAEDDQHAKMAPKDPNQLPAEERVRELIYRLRDQRMSGITDGRFAMRIRSEGATKSPAHQLVDLGYTAVPQLITAIQSPTLTRSLARDTHAPIYRVLPVSNFAVVILEQITGKSWGRSETNTQAAFQAWWAEFQKKGEKQMLVDGVSSGGRDAAAQADMLVARYPDAAAAALMQGIKAADPFLARTRADLLERLGKLPSSPATTDFFMEEMRHGPQLRARVAAAYVLRQQGKSEAVTAMIDECEKSPLQGPEEGGVLGELQDFLASCDSAQAIEALGHNLRQRPAEIKSHVLASVGNTNRPGKPTQSPATIEAIEKFLVGALEDTDEYQGFDAWENGMSVSDPRIYDVAEWLLAQRWPNRYVISLPGNPKARERRRIEFLNTWRAPHQLPTLPLPQPEHTPLAPAEAAKVTVVEWSPDSAKPTDSFAARIGGFKDKLLRAEELIALTTDFTHNAEPGVSGLIIKADKDEYLSGVSLTLTLLARQRTKTEWQWNDLVVVGTQTNDIHGIGRGWFSGIPPLDQGTDIVGVLQKAIDSPPETPFEINLVIHPNSL